LFVRDKFTKGFQSHRKAVSPVARNAFLMYNFSKNHIPHVTTPYLHMSMSPLIQCP